MDDKILKANQQTDEERARQEAEKQRVKTAFKFLADYVDDL